MNVRELDAWLAEHLFGWEFWEETRPNYTHVYWQTDGRKPWERTQKAYQQPEKFHRIAFSEYEPKRHIYEGVKPTFSSTGDGMLLVLEAMRARGFDLDLLTDAGTWRCDFDNGTIDTHKEAATAPRAVALAAKAALEASK